MQLRQYQSRMLVEVTTSLQRHQAAMLWADVGLGKTVVAASAAANLAQRVLVVAPRKVADLTWPDELRAWPHLGERPIVKLTSSASPAKRVALLADLPPECWVLTNYELLRWLAKWQSELASRRNLFDLVIFDEVDKLKSASSAAFKSARKLAVERRLGMTGTPGTEGLLDLWAQVTAVKDGALGRSFYEYRRTHFMPSDYKGWKWTPAPWAKETTLGKIKPFTSRFAKEDYLDLPEVVPVDHYLDLNPQAQKAYDDLKKNLLAHVGGATVTALQQGALFGKLQQVASGFLYDEDHGVTELDASKYEALEGMVSELQGAQVLVVFAFRAQAKALAERFKSCAFIDGQTTAQQAKDAVDAWNGGNLPMLCIHPAAASHGLNLQKSGAHHIVFLSLPTSGRQYLQVIGRLHRMGQTNRVIVHRLLARKTVDVAIRDALESKDATERDILATILRGAL